MRLGNLGTDVESLLQLRLGSLLEDLGPEHLIATVPGIVFLGDLLLLLQRHGKELLCALHDGFLLRQGNRVANNLEKAIVKTAGANLVHDLLLESGVPRVEA